MTFNALSVDFHCNIFPTRSIRRQQMQHLCLHSISNCEFTLGVKQTWQLLAVQSDTTISISGVSICQIKDIQSRFRERGDTERTTSSSKFDCSCRGFFPSFGGEKLGLRGRKVRQQSGVTAWSLSSGVRSASWRLRHSPFSLDGLSAGGGQTSCCIDDEEDVQRGRQRSDSHGVPGSVPGRFPPRPAARHVVSACAHIHIFCPVY